MPKERVLVIDDEEDVREVLKLHLDSAGYNVVEAENGEVGINILRSEDNMVNVGLILLDIRMPQMDGMNFIKILKHHTLRIPVIVLTGYPDRQMGESLKKMGVKEFLVKPIEKQKLIESIRKFAVLGPNSHN